MVPGRTGGIRELCELIDEHGDELQADFRQFYGLRLADVFQGALAPWEALALAEQLASEPLSRYRAAALGDPMFLGHGRTESILSDLADLILDNSLVTVKAAGGKARRPDRYERPDASKPQQVEVMDIDDFPIHLVLAMTRGPKQ